MASETSYLVFVIVFFLLIQNGTIISWCLCDIAPISTRFIIFSFEILLNRVLFKQLKRYWNWVDFMLQYKHYWKWLNTQKTWRMYIDLLYFDDKGHSTCSTRATKCGHSHFIHNILWYDLVYGISVPIGGKSSRHQTVVLPKYKLNFSIFLVQIFCIPCSPLHEHITRYFAYLIRTFISICITEWAIFRLCK